MRLKKLNDWFSQLIHCRRGFVFQQSGLSLNSMLQLSFQLQYTYLVWQQMIFQFLEYLRLDPYYLWFPIPHFLSSTSFSHLQGKHLPFESEQVKIHRLSYRALISLLPEGVTSSNSTISFSPPTVSQSLAIREKVGSPLWEACLNDYILEVQAIEEIMDMIERQW